MTPYFQTWRYTVYHRVDYCANGVLVYFEVYSRLSGKLVFSAMDRASVEKFIGKRLPYPMHLFKGLNDE